MSREKLKINDSVHLPLGQRFLTVGPWSHKGLGGRVPEDLNSKVMYPFKPALQGFRGQPVLTYEGSCGFNVYLGHYHL